MSEAIIAQKSPISEDLDAGQRYFWCACGRSQSQPFCDGSHKGTGFSPVKYETAESEKVFWRLHEVLLDQRYFWCALLL